MKTLGYYNGAFGEIESMYVPMSDRACYFGDGVYDVAYCYNHKIFALNEHVDRFLNSAHSLQIKPKINKEELAELVKRMVDKVDGDTLSVYMQLSRGNGFRDHEYSREMESNLWLMIRDTKLRNMEKPIEVGLCQDKRHGYCGHKTLNLLANVIAYQEAKEKGYEEVILHRNGMVSECAHSNLSIIIKGTVITPSPKENIFDGIARRHLLKACEESNIQWKYGRITTPELKNADEVVITASGSLCIDVQSIAGNKVGGKDGGTLKKIREKLVQEFNLETGSNIYVER